MKTIEEYFNDIRQSYVAADEFQLSKFMYRFTDELQDAGVIEGFDLCHYIDRGVRVDGSSLSEDGVLDLFVADFESRDSIETIGKQEVEAALGRVVKFYENCVSLKRQLYKELEVTSPEFSLAELIFKSQKDIRQINIYLISERSLSGRIKDISINEISNVSTNYHIWDISRFHRQSMAHGQREPLEIDIVEMFGTGIPCLAAHLGQTFYKSYLAVVPGNVLSELYGKYGSRLLEQNVRNFLKVTGNVNKGIRKTIYDEPQMFFSYNNGITATASDVSVKSGDDGLYITNINNFQIVNGGQTTASLFFAKKNNKEADLNKIFVQMKLSVITPQDSEEIVPRISEYANTQNKVNVADLSSNAPFHIKMEDMSRRIWAPAAGGLRETKWFYERTRGQYDDSISKLTPAKQKNFLAEYPKSQKFNKTDLGKYENLWDGDPSLVNKGQQANFADYAKRINAEWKESSVKFDEKYYRRAVARAIIFKSTESIVSSQSWYQGSYRANIVAYAIACIAELCRLDGKTINYEAIWTNQKLSKDFSDAIAVAAQFAFLAITHESRKVQNVTQWCRRPDCWLLMKSRIKRHLEDKINQGFWRELVDVGLENAATQVTIDEAKKKHQGECYARVLALGADFWREIAKEMIVRQMLDKKQMDALTVACNMPRRNPSEKEGLILYAVLDKAVEEGIANDDVLIK